jgi:hypothetical protein
VTLEFKWGFEQRGFDETRFSAEKYSTTTTIF